MESLNYFPNNAATSGYSAAYLEKFVKETGSVDPGSYEGVLKAREVQRRDRVTILEQTPFEKQAVLAILKKQLEQATLLEHVGATLAWFCSTTYGKDKHTDLVHDSKLIDSLNPFNEDVAHIKLLASQVINPDVKHALESIIEDSEQVTIVHQPSPQKVEAISTAQALMNQLRGELQKMRRPMWLRARS